MKDLSYIDRMKEEKEELEIKFGKLDIFITNNKDDLSKEELMLMYHQKQVINEYVKVLEDRILFSEFKEEVRK